MEDLSLIEKIQLLFETGYKWYPWLWSDKFIFYAKKEVKIFEVRDYKDNLKNSVFSLASAFDIDYYYMERKNHYL